MSGQVARRDIFWAGNLGDNQMNISGFIHLLGGLVVGAAIVVMFIAWQFSQGPIPIGFLSPYIEAAVNQGNREILRMGETILTWAGWERALDIRVLNVQVVDQKARP